MRYFCAIAACVIGLHGPAAARAGSSAPAFYTRDTVKTTREVVEDLEFAITERNFRVTGRMHVGRGIRERGLAEFPDYEVILFCNLGFARQMLELDPSYINYCPGRVTVRRDRDRTVISAPLLPEPDANRPLAEVTRRINSYIRDIVDYGTEQWSPAVELPVN